MPRKAKVTEPEAQTPVEATPVEEQAHGAKTAAIKEALLANPTKGPKEIAKMVTEQGFETTANYVSGVKAKFGGKKKAAPAPATKAAAPALPKDAVSLALLQKAKKLAAQFGSIKEAKVAIDALAQILD